MLLLAGLGVSGVPGVSGVSGVAWATDVQGELLADAEWGPQGNPWVVTGDVVVPEAITLTLLAGAEVRFDLDDLAERGTPRTELLVEGTLLALGEADEPVVLTTLSNNPVRGQWEGVTVDIGGVANLLHTEISWAVGGLVAEGGSEVTLTDVAVRQSSGTGVRAHDEASLTIERGSYSFNTSQGVRVGEGTHSMTDAIVLANGGIGVYVLMAAPASTFLANHLTVVGNSSGAYLSRGDHRTVIELTNSIVARNGWGIRGAAQAQAPETHHNDVWDNQGGTRDWQEGARAGAGSFSANPLLVDITTEAGLRPTENSPVRGAGDDGSDLGALPYDGDPTVGLQGVLRSNRTLPEGEHRIVGDLTVPQGVTLQLDPGAEVRFATTDAMKGGLDRARTELIIEGVLQADGDPDDRGRIVLRSASDLPARGNWYGVRFVSADQHSMSGVDVMHGSTCVRAEAGATLQLDDVRISDCSADGVVAEDLSSVQAYESVVRDCGTHGFVLHDGEHGLSETLVHGVGSAGVNVVIDDPDTMISLERLTLYGNLHGVLSSRNDEGASLELRDLLVARNGSYGIYAVAGTLALDHALVWDNNNGARDLVGAIEPGPVMIRANPLLADPGGADFRLTHRSPAIGAASDGDDLGAFPFDGDLQSAQLMGTLRADRTLTADASPHLISGDLIIPEGVTLTIEPGAEIRLGPGDGMEAGVDRARTEVIVYGTLHTAGAEGARITWTSGAGAPARGDWHSIRLAPSSAGNAWRHVDLAWSVRGLTVESDDDLSVSDSTFTEASTELLALSGDGEYEVVGCELASSASDGLRIDDLDRDNVPDGGAARIVVRDTVVRRVGGWGIRAHQDHPDARVDIDHCTVWNNAGGAVLSHRLSPESQVVVRSSVVARSGHGVYVSAGLPPRVSHNDVWGNVAGRDYTGVQADPASIALNPLVVDPVGDDLRLTDRSPCRGAGEGGSDIGGHPYDGDATGRLLGALTEDLTLTDRGAPWVIEGDLIVPEGITLTVEPGADVALAVGDAMEAGRDRGRTEIRVYGSLVAAGTPEAPIVFRSVNEPGDGGAWYGIQLLPGSVGNVLSDVILRNGYHPVQVETDDAVDLDRLRMERVHASGVGVALRGEGAYRLRDSWIESGWRGVLIGDADADGTPDGGRLDVEVTGTTLFAMATAGLYALSDHPQSRVLIDHNSARNGGGVGIYLIKQQEGSDVTVTNNVVVGFSHGIYSAGLSLPTASHNVAWGNVARRDFTGFVVAPGRAVRPLWVDPAGGDLRPTERSPLRGEATDRSEIGAYRYDGAPTDELMGWLRGDHTLHDRGEPWVIAGDLYVPAGVTLTVQAGTEIRLGPGDAMAGGWDTARTEVIVDGTLRVLGLSAAPVRWASSAGVPAPGDWRGIRLRPGSAAHVLDHLHVDHAYDPVLIEADAPVTLVAPRLEAIHASGVGVDVAGLGPVAVLDGWIGGGWRGVRIGDADSDNVPDGGPVRAEVRRTIFHRTEGHGIWALTDDPGADVLLDHNTLTGRSAGYGIGAVRARPDGRFVVRDNVAVGFAYGIRNDGAVGVDMHHNVAWGNVANRNFSRSLDAPAPGLEQNPLWVDPDGGDYAPTAMSPLRRNDSGGGSIGAVAFDGAVHPLLAGWLHEDRTLTEAGSPWLISGDLFVPPGRALVLEPGAELRMSPRADVTESGVDRGRIELIVAGLLDAGGAPGAPIVLTPDAAEPGRSEWYGLRFVGESEGSTVAHVRLHNPHFGVVHESTGELSLADLEIDEVGDCAILALADAGPLRITRSTFSHIGNYGLRSFNADVSVTSSVVWDSRTGFWPTLTGLDDRVELIHNTVHDSAYGVRFDKRQESSVGIVRNNLISDTSSNAIWSEGVWDPVVEHNALHDWTGQAVANLEAAPVGRLELADPPGYVGADAGDFRLTADSPVIDRGLSLGLPPRDRSGRPRSLPGTLDGDPAPDMGAYEYDPGFPVVLSLAPARIQQGATVAARVLGESLPADSALDFGPGLSVQNLERVGEAELTFDLVADVDAVVGVRDLALTWDGGRTDGLDVLTVVSGPQIEEVAPSSLRQGEVAAVSVSGRNFLPGLRVSVDGGVLASVVRGRDVRPGGFDVQLAVPAQAGPGFRAITVTNPDGGLVTARELFEVVAAIEPPEVVAVQPAALARGSRQREVTVTGSGFQAGARVRIPGPGIVLGATRFVDARELVVTVDVAEDAPVGARDLRVENPDGGAGRLVAGFEVASGLVVEAVDPDSLLLGDLAAPINVFGQRFGEGALVSFVGPGGVAGVVAAGVAVLGSTRLLVNVDVDPDAVEGLYDVVVELEGDVAVGEGLLSVGAGGPVRLVRSEPPGVGQGALDHRLVLRGSNLGEPAQVTVSGPGVSVGGVARLGASAINITVDVAADALIGPRDVSITFEDGTRVQGPGILDVIAAPRIVQAAPPTLALGAVGVEVALLGEGLDPAEVSVDGLGVEVMDLRADGPQRAVVVLSVWQDAEPGPRTLRLTNNDGGRTVAADLLTVVAPPTLQAINPERALVGTSVRVSITGDGIRPGATAALSGLGVTGREPQVAGDTLQITFDVEADAAPGPRDVIVLNLDGGEAVLPGAFELTPRPAVIDVDPGRLRRGTRGALLVAEGRFLQPGVEAEFPGGSITVVRTRFVSADSIDIEVDVDPDADLGPHDLVVVNPDGGRSDPVGLVTVVGADARALQAAPDALFFVASVDRPAPPQHVVRVTHSAPPAGRFTATAAAPWLTLPRTDGVSGQDELIVGLVPERAAALGTLRADVRVSDGVESVRVPVTVEMVTGPEFDELVLRPGGLQVIPRQFDLDIVRGDRARAQQMMVRMSVGEGTDFVVTSDQPWVRVSPPGGRTPLPVQVEFDLADKAARPQPYRAELTVRPLDEQVADVRVQVRAFVRDPAQGMRLQVSPQALLMGAEEGSDPDPATLQVRLDPGGARPFEVTVEAGGDWLFVDPAQGETPGAVFVRAEAAAMSEDDSPLQGSLRVTGPAGTAPVDVPVTLLIGAVPPVADAGPGYAGPPTVVTLDGSASVAAEGIASYAWSVAGAPAGVDAAGLLSAADAEVVTALLKTPGDYLFDLVITDEQGQTSAPDRLVARIDDVPPVADAGLGMVWAMAAGRARVGLTAARSRDANGDRLGVSWTQVGGPAAEIEDAGRNDTVAVAHRAGVYVFEAQVDDGGQASTAQVSHVVQADDDHVPTAVAGADRRQAWGARVRLDGGGSVDPDGDPLTWLWRQVAGPRDVLLEGADTATPSFQTPASGRFEFELVIGDGRHTSPPDRVAILLDRPDDRVPIADAGEDREAIVGERVVLSAQGSSDPPDDPDGAALTVRWALGPAGGGPEPPIANAQDPEAAWFHPVVAGVHRLSLTVEDGRHASSPDELVVVVDGANTLPRPDAERVSFQAGNVGQPLVLDASDLRDPDGEPVTARWRQVGGPWLGLDDPTRTIARGRPVAAGRYVWMLSLDDGRDRGPEVEFAVEVTPTPNAAPVAVAGDDQTVAVGDLVLLDGGLSQDDDGDELTYEWALLRAPMAVPVNQQVAWQFVAAVPGEYAFSLVVSDGLLVSDADAVTVVAQAAPIDPGPGDGDGGDGGQRCEEGVDGDGDGVQDCDEFDGDSDRDGRVDREDPDDDGDGVPSVEETPRGDSDGDGVPDRLDVDDDGDGVPTSLELGEGDTDGDGVPDYLDPDDDGDGDPTKFELPRGDSDRDGVADYLDADDTDGPGPKSLVGVGAPAPSSGCATSLEAGAPRFRSLSAGLLVWLSLMTPVRCGASADADGFPGRTVCEEDGYAIGVQPTIPAALAWDGQGMWVASANQPVLRRLDLEAGPQARSVRRVCGPYQSTGTS